MLHHFMAMNIEWLSGAINSLANHDLVVISLQNTGVICHLIWDGLLARGVEEMQYVVRTSSSAIATSMFLRNFVLSITDSS
jgi:hypothetical protein